MQQFAAGILQNFGLLVPNSDGVKCLDFGGLSPAPNWGFGVPLLNLLHVQYKNSGSVLRI